MCMWCVNRDQNSFIHHNSQQVVAVHVVERKESMIRVSKIQMKSRVALWQQPFQMIKVN